MRLPEIQSELEYLADRITKLAKEISRRPPTKRAPPSSLRVTPELKRKIKAYALAHPRMTYQKVSEKFGVNGGRVSEAVKGKRK